MCIHHSPFLAETIPLAEEGRGSVAPNPMVGALVVKDGTVVATGYHQRYGDRHAEAVALDNAGKTAQGATLYCNLEPCSFTADDKHQPPCTRRIIEAGVDTVVIGQLDPNPRVRGDGVRQLEEAGISVLVERNDEPFRRFNDVFNTVMTARRPFVHLKTAISLDGRIATADGTSRWITDDAARAEVHALRAERDAVLVGVGTVLTDDPLLTVRVGPVRAPSAGTLEKPGAMDTPAAHAKRDATQPIPIVLDTHLRTPVDAQLVRRRGHELIIIAAERTTNSADAPAATSEFARRRAQLEKCGVTVLTTPADQPTAVDLPAALQLLFSRGIRSILVEGGAAVTTAFLRSGLYDRLTTYIAPIIIGSGIEAVGDLGTPTPTAAPRLTAVSWHTIGDQQVCNGYHPDWFQRTAVAPVAPVDPVKEETHVHRAH